MGSGHTNSTATKKAVLESLRQGAYVVKAAEAAGITAHTVHSWRRKDAAFAAKMDEALKGRITTVVDALYSKAVGGNVTAMIFYLCNRACSDWRHVQHIQHAGDIAVTHRSTTELINASDNGGFGRSNRIRDLLAAQGDKN